MRRIIAALHFAMLRGVCVCVCVLMDMPSGALGIDILAIIHRECLDGSLAIGANLIGKQQQNTHTR